MRKGAARGEVIGQHVGREVGLLLIEVDGEQLEPDGRAPAHVEQQVEHRVAVLAAGQADHHAVAVRDHPEVLDRLAHLAQQAGFDLALDKHGSLSVHTEARSVSPSGGSRSNGAPGRN